MPAIVNVNFNGFSVILEETNPAGTANKMIKRIYSGQYNFTCGAITADQEAKTPLYGAVVQTPTVTQPLLPGNT
jgi:hypothetical protein